MKKASLLSSIVAVFAFVTLTSYSGGSSTNMTGSHGDMSGCSGSSCHGKRDAGMGVAIEILDSAFHPVYTYRPGKKYLLRMTSFNLSTVSLPKYGFQMVVQDNNNLQTGKYDPATIQSGTMLDSSSVPLPVIYEQKMRLSPSVGGGDYGTTYVNTIAWTAPPLHTDTIKIYGIACLVNNDGDTTGDKWNSGMLAVPEETFASVGDVHTNSIVAVWPNPVASVLHIAGSDLTTGNYSVNVYSLDGKNVFSENFSKASLASAAINAAAWPQGLYQVVIAGEGIKQTIPLFKQ